MAAEWIFLEEEEENQRGWKFDMHNAKNFKGYSRSIWYSRKKISRII